MTETGRHGTLVGSKDRSPRLVSERLAVVSVLVLVMVVTGVPYLYGLVTCPSDKVFLGLLGPYGNDQAFYLGWGPKQAEAGNLLFEDKYNGHTDTRLVFNPLWLLMGWAARLTGLSVLLVFHLERAAFSMLLLAQAYAILSRFLDGLRWRIAALWLVAFSSGFGVLGVPLSDWTASNGTYRVPAGRWTPDLWVAESNTFLIMLGELVLPAAMALFLMTIRHGVGTFWDERRSAVRTGLLTLLLGTIYPYAVVSAWAILGAFAAFRAVESRRARPSLLAYLTVVALSCPVVLYDGFLVLRDARLTMGQALYASPDLWQYFLGFGLAAVFAVPGALVILRRAKPEHRLLLLWIAVTCVVIYIPRRVVPFQLQLVLGLQVPLVTTAVYGVASLWARWSPVGRGALRRTAGMTLLVLVPLACLTSAYHVMNTFASLQRRQLPEYMSRETAEAISWLSRHSRGSDVVLSAPEIAPYIPVLANNRVYCGDYAAPTADFAAKQEHIARMLSPETDEAAILRFLREERIRYVLYDPELRRREGESGRLAARSMMERVFENASVTVFRVDGLVRATP